MFGTVSALIARKNTCAYYISALSCHTASCRAQPCWKQDQKYKTMTKTKAARPRPKDWYKPILPDSRLAGSISSRRL